MTERSHLQAVQAQLIDHGLDALVVPSSDEHLNEYVLPHGQRREWLSGFNGSAGDALITPTEAWLFVDSRYHLQVDTQVDTQAWQVQKLGQPGAKSLTTVIEGLSKTNATFTLGACPQTLSAQQASQLAGALPQGKLVATPHNLIDAQWQTQPDYPQFTPQPVYALADDLTGQTCAEKLAAVRQQWGAAHVIPVVKLDQLAWLLNWRGHDIPYNPLFVAYALITPDALHLFTDAPALPPVPAGVTLQCHPYAAYIPTLQAMAPHHAWLVDTASMNWQTLLALSEATQVKGVHPITPLKAIKTPQEQDAMRQANLQASVAICQALAWLDAQVAQGHAVTEAQMANRLEGFYAAQPGYAGQSFNTIAGTGPNGAIVHYGTPSATTVLENGQLFLLDSGAHYLGGTTDTTRTVCIGQPTQAQRQFYTLVLKAHLALIGSQFPVGTNGAQLDGIARQPMWQAGADYGHGTGHGVGAFLCVHEGPNGIHKAATTVLQPGMVTSIEPGYYRTGWGGIRLENLALCIPAKTSGWLTFESLTWVPFCAALIDRDLLSPGEYEALCQYQHKVCAQLTPHLDVETLHWVKTQCI